MRSPVGTLAGSSGALGVIPPWILSRSVRPGRSTMAAGSRWMGGHGPQSGSSQSTRPSPSLSRRSLQISVERQELLQPSPGVPLRAPSSHCSPASRMPLPQVGSVQLASQPSLFTWLPSSHCSPGSTMPLPQRVTVQLLSQPSPFTWLPSSHCSPGSTTPLPQAGSVQLASQPSPFTWLPSSHCSPGSRMPLPQPVNVQLLSQPSPFAWLPSSHCSPGSRMPLPQPVNVQLWSQPSPSIRLPSSHCSPGSTMPLPQRVAVQLLSQPSPFTWLPSSHSSPAWLTTPSPQRAGAQFLAAVPVTVPVAGGPASTMPCLAGSLNSRPTGTVKEAEAVIVSLPVTPKVFV